MIKPSAAVSSSTRSLALRLFFVAFALVAASLVLTGFGRTFFLPLARRTFSAPWFVYVHGTLFLTWIGLLTTQSILVARHRTTLHRSLGRVAAGLIPLMVASGVVVAFWASARDVRKGGGDEVVAFFCGELMDMLLFGVLATAALLTRRHPQAHKRLIVLATLAILGAAVGRIPVLDDVSNYVTFALLLCLVGYDFRVRPRLHPATAAGGLFLLAGTFSQNYIGSTSLWLEFGRRLLGFVHYGAA